MGYTIVSSGGTHRYLKDRGIVSVAVEELTGYPEMLGGRVKTLHPAIYGGILCRRENDEDMQRIAEMDLPILDIVVVNLYPFEETVRRPGSDMKGCIEMIDIGGPSLIRAAAKNHEHVTVLVDPGDYPFLMERIEKGSLTKDDRLRLALKAFRHVSAYDISISEYLVHKMGEDVLPEHLRMRFEKAMDLRYGENPHQRGSCYSSPSFTGTSIHNSRILGGKELSYNNIFDVDAALDILMEFPEEPCCVIIKHNNPSGVSLGRPSEHNQLKDAFLRALDCDPLSAFGGVVGLNRGCDVETASSIMERFFEVVIAPAFDEAALDILRSRKNLRIISTDRPIVEEERREEKWVKIRGGLLAQTMEWPPFDPSGWVQVTEKAPTDGQIKDMVFASKVVKHVKSNCVVLAKDQVTTGIGSGQMSRVDSCFMAAHKAGDRAEGSVLASDAFFPFRDGIDTLAATGVAAICQPGGSIRDKEVIDAANQHGMAMLFTGVRLFKH